MDQLSVGCRRSAPAERRALTRLSLGGIIVEDLTAMVRLVASLALLVACFSATVGCHLHEDPSCQSDIVSASAISSFCGHAEGPAQVLDLVILWRAEPGWCQALTPGGVHGGGGSRSFGAGTRGHVSEIRRYGDITIGFDADFDAEVLTVGSSSIPLDRVNTVVLDYVAGEWRVAAKRWTEPRPPMAGDWNLALARRSPEFLRDLRCELPMPAADSARREARPQVVTVCERLK